MSKTINKYVIQQDSEGYVSGFYAVLDDNYDYEGQMADFPEACEGWTKFENGTFVIDQKRKEEIIAEREEEYRKADKDANWLAAQTLYTALITDTLLEEE